ncbi:bifunctional precorrin-2 dehydrogenase/sirohydrochlorin ferrochelatase [Paenibacillus sp. N3.4]|uniref:precorrin-2 dehydrogenase/sirohydrochlorin ferrochelatase family protein n=1 Tax=Paenibacillus sp. N3.4 TaxID=2603222 RepID=UPI00164FDAC8|nr:bifunctional precorrin-2 dehydrogenase/sirohydrochlorin ferrochelatase [Paenibacillus sp. N3.4]
MSYLYPIMVNMQGRRCLVVGGGQVAERKVHSLLQAGAQITIVSQTFTDYLTHIGSRKEVVLIWQSFDETIMLGESHKAAPYTLIVAATNDALVNRQVYEAASRQGQLVNVVDQPMLSSFIVPSVVRRGKLVMAVSTGGASPSAARKIAQELDTMYGQEYESYLEFLSDVRLIVQAKIEDMKARQLLFKEMLEWDVLARIREGTFESWKDELFTALENESAQSVIMAFGQQA